MEKEAQSRGPHVQDQTEMAEAGSELRSWPPPGPIKTAFSQPCEPFCLQNPMEIHPLSLGLSVLCHCERISWREPKWVKVQSSLCDLKGHFTSLGLFSCLWWQGWEVIRF